NRERNEELKAGLEELLAAFEKEGIDSILLKGAATFVDDLYGAPGARYMGDLDILVPNDRIENGREILINLGYEVVPDEDMELTGHSTDIRHHQIQRYTKAGTPLAVELHFRLSYGQAGRIISVDNAWNESLEVKLSERHTRLLSPNHRIHLNIAHALLPHREFIKGEILLSQLTEFATLVNRYHPSIDWPAAITGIARIGFSSEASAYAQLACRYLSCCIEEFNWTKYQDWHLDRVSHTWEKKIANEIADIEPVSIQKSLIYRLYYLIQLPNWFWQNVSYADGYRHLPHRLWFVLTKLFRWKSWKK
ncbi:MAG: nucleotidyltransferase family protein, partial [Aestuariibacter sp.]|nr:nucleotidyltransferase family protein [Aestuariibacter sp.]